MPRKSKKVSGKRIKKRSLKNRKRSLKGSKKHLRKGSKKCSLKKRKRSLKGGTPKKGSNKSTKKGTRKQSTKKRSNKSPKKQSNESCKKNNINNVIDELKKGNLPPRALVFLKNVKNIDDIQLKLAIKSKQSDLIKAENITGQCKVKSNSQKGGGNLKNAIAISALVAIATAGAVYATYLTLPEACSQHASYINSLIAGAVNIPSLNACAINEKTRTEVLQAIGGMAAKGMTLSGISGVITGILDNRSKTENKTSTYDKPPSYEE